MAHSALRWVLAGVSLLVVGPLLSVVTGFSPAPEGYGAITPLLSSSPVVGVLAWVVACAAAGVVGVLVASVTTWRLGVACIGLSLVWSAWGSPRLDELVRVESVGDPSWLMAIDGLIVAGVACGFAWACARKWESRKSVELAPQSRVAMGVLGCAIAAMIAAGVVARDDPSGQAIGAAVVAGYAGGAMARGIAPGVASCWLLAGLPLAALAAPIIGGMMTPGAVDEATYTGAVSPLLRVMPAHWVVGVLIGFPAGESLAEGMAEKHGAPATAGAPAV